MRFLALAISPAAPLGWMQHVEKDIEPRGGRCAGRVAWTIREWSQCRR